MTSVKIKLRKPLIKGKESSLFYQIIHKRVVRQIKTEYKIFFDEWDTHSSEIKIPLFDENRKKYLLSIKELLKLDINGLTKIIYFLDMKRMPYTTDDIIKTYHNQSKENTLSVFMQNRISQLKLSGKIRTSETYASALNSFMRFRKDEDITLDEINPDLIIAYEAYLEKESVGKNSISFYMRILRAVYNRAIEKGLVTQQYPFRQVYTGIPKTIKRAIPLKTIKQIKELNFTLNPSLDYVRDMFLFSFYTRGMSFIDMVYLKKKNLQNGILFYRRKKTGQQLCIKWENCMQEIVDKYQIAASPYLLPIIKNPDQEERKQYKNAIFLINRKLKDVGKKVNLSIPLTMYVARHSWASIAKSKNIPISVISEGMGHDSEATTQIYLASLDASVVDKANQLILKCF
jgi:site-specific recombinase XerD